MGCPAFNKVIKCLQKIQDHLEKALPEDKLDKWTPSYTASGHPAIDLSNRYVTNVKDKGIFTSLPVTDLIDPYGYLHKVMGRFWHYTDNNEVECFKRYKKEMRDNGEKKYRYSLIILSSSSLTPISSRPLDIVALRTGHFIEAQVSMIAWPSSNGRWRMSLVIRKVLLVDNECIIDLVSYWFYKSQKKSDLIKNQPLTCKRSREVYKDEEEED